MHEVSLAQSLVDSVLSEVKRQRAKKVLELEVGVGELMQLDRKALAFGFRLLLTGPVLGGARLRVRTAHAAFSCRKCQSTWGMDEVKRQLEHVPEELLVREPDSKEIPLHFLPLLYSAFIACPHCGSSDVQAVEGKALELRRLVLQK